MRGKTCVNFQNNGQYNIEGKRKLQLRQLHARKPVKIT